MKKYQHVIDLTDRVDAYRRSEMDLASEDSALTAQVEQQPHWLDMGCILLGGREAGDAPEDIIPDLDGCLNLGAAEAWRLKVKGRTRTIQIGDEEVSVREVVGIGEGDETSGYAWYDSPSAADSAERYLLRVVPGHIVSRVRLLAYQGRDMTQVEQELLTEVRAIFARYQELPTEALAVEMGG